MARKRIDILALDGQIKQRFMDQIAEIPTLQQKIEQMEKLRVDGDVSPRTKHDLTATINHLHQKINHLQSRDDYNFYLLATSELIEQYRQILTRPIVMSFTGKKKENNSAKTSIINQYLEIANQYIPIPKAPVGAQKVKCNNCPNNKDFDIFDTSIYICLHCGSQQTVLRPTSSYNDIDRVNISTKYRYARRVHFRDCVNQYQGKQNCTIEPEVYDGLEKAFASHRLLIGDENIPREERFQRITKEHIFIFLKDLGFNKHYENINLIHYNMTGQKPDDISHLETKLFDDFEVLTGLYDKVYKFGKRSIDRSSFINTDYVLFQLLRRHKHPCKLEDFSELKTIERKAFHDEICKNLFHMAGWNHTSLF